MENGIQGINHAAARIVRIQNAEEQYRTGIEERHFVTGNPQFQQFQESKAVLAEEYPLHFGEIIDRKFQNLPENVFCPISQVVMVKPVRLASCTHAFDRTNIKHWFDQGHHTCPTCRTEFSETDIQEDGDLTALIRGQLLNLGEDIPQEQLDRAFEIGVLSRALADFFSDYDGVDTIGKTILFTKDGVERPLDMELFLPRIVRHSDPLNNVREQSLINAFRAGMGLGFLYMVFKEMYYEATRWSGLDEEVITQLRESSGLVNKLWNDLQISWSLFDKSESVDFVSILLDDENSFLNGSSTTETIRDPRVDNLILQGLKDTYCPDSTLTGDALKKQIEGILGKKFSEASEQLVSLEKMHNVPPAHGGKEVLGSFLSGFVTTFTIHYAITTAAALRSGKIAKVQNKLVDAKEALIKRGNAQDGLDSLQKRDWGDSIGWMLNPNASMTYYYLETALRIMNNEPEKAIESAKKGAPDNALHQYNHAMALIALGQFENARAQFEHCQHPLTELNINLWNRYLSNI